MDNYNQLLLQQLAPYLRIHVSGEISADVVINIRKFIHLYDISHKVWDNSIIKNRLSSTKYIIELVEGDEKLPQREISSSNEHSNISPFNQSSPIFPNGILPHQWLSKYIEEIPFAYVSILKLPSDVADDVKLATVINELKKNCLKQSVKLIAIIVSSSPDPNEDDERINKLRQLTGLPRLVGLLYLHDSAATLVRDTEILVSTLLSNLKSSAVDFYSNIKYKIEQRHKKYYSIPSTRLIDTQIELSPKFLETRNLIKIIIIDQFIAPHDLEPSLKLLEVAYQSLIDIMRDTFHSRIFDLDSISDHDLKLYFHFRSLIDMLAFHIIRGYFSTEEPLVALKKHRAHIANVLSVSEPEFSEVNNNWVSVQYEWLAELMKLVPSSIIASTHSKKKLKPNSGMIGFFGGIKFKEAYSFEVITNPGLVYLKSNEHLIPSEKMPTTRFNYLFKYKDKRDMVQHKIELLSDSIASLTPETQAHAEEEYFEALISYLNYLTAEEYYMLGALEEAISYYERSDKSISMKTSVSSVILQKLVQCYSSTKDPIKQVSSFLKLATLKPFFNIHQKYPIQGLFENSSEIAINNEVKLFKTSPLILNESLHQDTYLYDRYITQIKLTSVADLSVIKKLFEKDYSALINIKSIIVKFERSDSKKTKRNKKVKLIHDGQNNSSMISKIELKEGDESDTLIGTGNLFPNEENGLKIIQFSQTASISGSYHISSIRIESEVEFRNGDKHVIVNNSELHEFDEYSSSHHAELYNEANGIINKKQVRLNGRSGNTIRFLPLRPSVSVTMTDEDINCLILGEKISIPFRINFKHPKNQKINYKSISLSPKVKVIADQKDFDFASRITTQVNWDGLKDDEALDLHPLVESDSNEATESHQLNVSVHCPPNLLNSRVSERGSTIVIDLKTIVSEIADEDEDIEDSVYDTANYTLPIINSPFKCSYIISPRYRADAIDMPSPFILSPSDDGQGTSMPIATRLWQGSLVVSDLYKKYEDSNSSLRILDTEFSVKSRNPELKVVMVSSAFEKDGRIHQLFTVSSRSGFSHRNAPMVTSVSINWQRKDGLVNNFKSEDWEITLPLSDPRVLLVLDEDVKEAGKVKLTYILENPTPRIFTFTTQMDTDDPSSTWDFSDVRNIVPVKQAAFPVLPFGRHFMEFYAKMSEAGEKIQLPTFKVYDVQYKVGLPTLSVSDNVAVKGSKLYWST
ncbi:hypothetical protein G9P44_000650 [Scheffersomyces stipitis]|nr:hypothetical protein G9P44_000650 [Scheffersomyces stipitis]